MGHVRRGRRPLGGEPYISPISPYISLHLPYASLYLSQVSAAGSAVGTCVLWTWAFSSQVLLVNILISMMTETYEKAYPWPSS